MDALAMDVVAAAGAEATGRFVEKLKQHLSNIESGCSGGDARQQEDAGRPPSAASLWRMLASELPPKRLHSRETGLLRPHFVLFLLNQKGMTRNHAVSRIKSFLAQLECHSAEAEAADPICGMTDIDRHSIAVAASNSGNAVSRKQQDQVDGDNGETGEEKFVPRSSIDVARRCLLLCWETLRVAIDNDASAITDALDGKDQRSHSRSSVSNSGVPLSRQTNTNRFAAGKNANGMSLARSSYDQDMTKSSARNARRRRKHAALARSRIINENSSEIEELWLDLGHSHPLGLVPRSVIKSILSFMPRSPSWERRCQCHEMKCMTKDCADSVGVINGFGVHRLSEQKALRSLQQVATNVLGSFDDATSLAFDSDAKQLVIADRRNWRLQVFMVPSPNLDGLKAARAACNTVFSIEIRLPVAVCTVARGFWAVVRQTITGADVVLVAPEGQFPNTTKSEPWPILFELPIDFAYAYETSPVSIAFEPLYGRFYLSNGIRLHAYQVDDMGDLSDEAPVQVKVSDEARVQLLTKSKWISSGADESDLCCRLCLDLTHQYQPKLLMAYWQNRKLRLRQRRLDECGGFMPDSAEAEFEIDVEGHFDGLRCPNEDVSCGLTVDPAGNLVVVTTLHSSNSSNTTDCVVLFVFNKDRRLEHTMLLEDAAVVDVAVDTDSLHTVLLDVLHRSLLFL